MKEPQTTDELQNLKRVSDFIYKEIQELHWSNSEEEKFLFNRCSEILSSIEILLGFVYDKEMKTETDIAKFKNEKVGVVKLITPFSEVKREYAKIHTASYNYLKRVSYDIVDQINNLSETSFAFKHYYDVQDKGRAAEYLLETVSLVLKNLSEEADKQS